MARHEARPVWEGGHRVPFVVRWPRRIAAGSESDQTVCLCDLMATCAAITGVDLPDNAAEDSFDILPAMLGESAARRSGARPYSASELPEQRGHRWRARPLYLAIRRGKWKYLDHRGSGGNDYEREELKRYALPERAPDAGSVRSVPRDPGPDGERQCRHDRADSRRVDNAADGRPTC